MHLKRKKTYNEPGHAHFLTYSCYQRLPLLTKDRSRTWVLEAIQSARSKCDFDLWAYVVMPGHVHLLLRPRQQQYRVARILAALKRPVAVQAKAHLIQTGNTEWLDKLTVKKGKKAIFRFWQTGGGYDENICDEKPVLEVIEYIHHNPVRRGLVEKSTDWAWSSSRFWAGDRSGSLAMDSLLL